MNDRALLLILICSLSACSEQVTPQHAPEGAASPAESALDAPSHVRFEQGFATLEMPRFELAVSGAAITTLLDGEPSWSWSLDAVNSEAALAASPVPSSLGDGAELDRGVVTEHYLARASGVVEQRFVLHEPLRNGGPLEITGFVDTQADIFEEHADGWVWRHDDGRTVAVGPAIAFDADGEPLEVYFDVDHDGTYLRIEADVLANAAYPVTIDPALGPADLVVSDVGPTGSALARANDAAVAYSSTADAFLVVWSADDTNFGTADNELEIFGRWVSANSDDDSPVVGDTFRISTQGVDGDAAVDGRQPAIVYAAGPDQFLVVWSGDLTAGNDEIYGQILDGTTGALIGANLRVSRQTVGDGSVDCLSPAVTWKTTTAEYGVLWESDVIGNGHQEIWGRRVSTAGAAMATALRGSFVGTEATTAQDSTDPDFIFDPSTDLYIAVWEADAVLGDNQIYAVRLGATIGPFTDPIPVSQMGTGDPSAGAGRPAIAYNSTANEVLVTWYGNEPAGPPQVWGQLLDSDAAEIGADFQVVDSWPAGSTATDVAVAYDSSDDEYLVAWEEDNGTTTQIGARTVDADGTPLGSAETISALTAAGGGGDAFDPAIAYSIAVDEFLVVFEGDDSRDGRVDDEDEIFAQFYGDSEASDRDGDGTRDELDGCPDDGGKLEPGACGCGVADVDTDTDGTLDCDDGCPGDSGKIVPGICGCGVADTDTDTDGTADCLDRCPDDSAKTSPGVCGCGVPDVDSDTDGTFDCDDGCPEDPEKTEAGVCGCGVVDVDSDTDGTFDCEDGCPEDPEKTEAGVCDCGTPDTDSDGDGAADCIDVCPDDIFDDSDSDGTCDSADNCPLTVNPDQADSDRDGLGDACDLCVDGDEDTDEDLICDLDDVCPDHVDPDQEDSDLDGAGDACDPCPNDRDDDVDVDGYCADVDVCPEVFDPLQLDLDDDGAGDACDDDDDDDAVPDDDDNCPRVANTDQIDTDGDGTGDACTDDRDGDTVLDDDDNCPDDPNVDQADNDADGLGDICDDDDDDDAVLDSFDNCPLDSNEDQADADSDGLGDVCDDDEDNDDITDDEDNCPSTYNPAQDDGDGDGVGDLCDICPDAADSEQEDGDDDGVGDVCDACPDESGSADLSGCPETGDVGVDTGPDVGPDAPPDVGLDASEDTGDVGIDAPDTESDVPITDIGFDGSTDAGDDVGGVDGFVPFETGSGCSCTTREGHGGAAGFGFLLCLVLARRRPQRMIS